MIEEMSKTYKFTICDPCMDTNLKSVKIYTTLSVSGKNVSSNKGWNIIELKLASGAETGKPVTVEVEKD